MDEEEEKVFLLLFWELEYLMDILELNIIATFVLDNFKEFFFSPIAYCLQHLQMTDTTISPVGDLWQNWGSNSVIQDQV